VDSGGPRRLNLWFVAVGVAIIVAAAVVGIVLATRSSSAQASGTDGSCVRQTFPPMGRQHVQKLSSDFQYNSYPPTSGPHYAGANGPIVWNLYDQPVDEIGLVHNLEHGGVVVQYGADVPDATVQEITRWYQEQSTQNGLVVAPIRPNIQAPPPADAGKKIYLTAWTHLMTCPNFDKAAFDNFVDDYRGPSGDAPEKFPLDALAPGGQ
jgi:Protein of unknown function (DUF3105)